MGIVTIRETYEWVSERVNDALECTQDAHMYARKFTEEGWTINTIEYQNHRLYDARGAAVKHQFSARLHLARSATLGDAFA